MEGDGEGVSLEAAEKRRRELAEHFAGVDKQLKGSREERQQAKGDTIDPTQSVAAFWQIMHARRADVSKLLEECEELKKQQQEGKKAEKETNEEIEKVFNKAISLCREFAAETARGALFLPPYDLRLAQDLSRKLLEEVHFHRTRLLLRGKFRFSNRKTPPRTAAEILLEREAKQKQKEEEEEKQKKENKDEGKEDGEGGDDGEGNKKGEKKNLSSIFEPPVDPSRRFSNEKGKTLIKKAGEIGGTEFVLSNLADCSVFLLDSCSAIHIHNLHRVRVVCSPLASGSILLDNCSHSQFVFCAQQIRIHSASSCDFYLLVKSHPIIEHSTAVRFAPYIFRQKGLDEQLKKLEMSLDSTVWSHAEDFNWLRSQHSPNWSLIPEAERLPLIYPPGEEEEGGGGEL